MQAGERFGQMTAFFARAHRLDEHVRKTVSLTLEAIGKSMARCYVGSHIAQHAFEVLIGGLLGYKRHSPPDGKARFKNDRELRAHDGEVLQLDARLRDVHGKQVLVLANELDFLDDPALGPCRLHGSDLVERLNHAGGRHAAVGNSSVGECRHYSVFFLM